MALRLDFSSAAIADLEAMNDYGIENFGLMQARRYSDGLFRLVNFLVECPKVGPRIDLLRRFEIRKFPYGSHLIFYRIDDDVLRVGRILRGEVDWRRSLTVEDFE